MAVGVAEGQMENILQEATKEEMGADAPKEGGDAVAAAVSDLKLEERLEQEHLDTVIHRQILVNGYHPEDKDEEDADSALPAPQEKEADEPEALMKQDLQSSSDHDELEERCSGEPEQPDAQRVVANGSVGSSAEDASIDDSCPDLDQCVSGQVETLDKRASLMESSTETLTEEACGRQDLPAQGPDSMNLQPCSDDRSPPPCSRKEHGFSRTLNGGGKQTSVSAFLSASADLSRNGLSNGDCSDGDPNGAPHSAKGSGERAPLSRQVSQASCNSLILHPRGSCSQHRWCHTVLSRATTSPEQPSRSHLDDDGLTLHTDAIQQRLRQIEAGHQMEVETLKKQVQELWSRLENQQHAGCHRINGDVGDELVRLVKDKADVFR